MVPWVGQIPLILPYGVEVTPAGRFTAGVGRSPQVCGKIKLDKENEMKKLITMISMLLATVALAATVFAAGSCPGKVTNVEDGKVVVTMEGAVPAWVKKGATVKALGGSPKVMSVNGNEVTLRMTKAKAAKVKVDSNVTVAESDEDEMQGC